MRREVLELSSASHAGSRVLISGRTPRGEVLLQPRGIVRRRACHLEGKGCAPALYLPYITSPLHPRYLTCHLEVKESAAALARALARALALDVEGNAVLAEARLPPHEVRGLVWC